MNADAERIHAINAVAPLNFATTVYSIYPIFPLLIGLLIAGVVLALVYVRWRKPIEVSLAAVGILELIPLFLLLVAPNVIAHAIPGILIGIFFVIGCFTLVSGVAIFFFAKPSLARSVARAQ